MNIFFSESIQYKDVKNLLGRDFDFIPAYHDIDEVKPILGNVVLSLTEQAAHNLLGRMEEEYPDVTLEDDELPIYLGHPPTVSVETSGAVVLSIEDL